MNFTNWSDTEYNLFLDELLKQKDQNYLEFNRRIVFTKNEMIGIRVPILKKISKDILKTNYFSFLKNPSSNYYEDLYIRGLVISNISDYETFCSYLKEFIPKIDNWAICDGCFLKTKAIINNRERFLKELKNYLKSGEEFTVRVGVIFLLKYYLDDIYIDETLKIICEVKNDKYYINMAIAWLLSEAFIKYQNKVIEIIKYNKVSDTIINMTISKIRDSKQVTKSLKDKIKKYKKALS